MKNSLLVIFAVAFAVCLFLVVRDCRAPDDPRIVELKEEIEARDEQLKIKEQGLQELRERNDALQAEKDGAIDSANTVIEGLKRDDHDKSLRIQSLESEYEKLQSKDEQIVNLRAQVGAWKGRFSLSQETIAEKDTIIFSLREKIEEEVRFRQAVEVVLQDYKNSIAVRDELISELTKKLHRTSRWRTLERLAGLALIGTLTYSALT